MILWKIVFQIKWRVGMHIVTIHWKKQYNCILLFTLVLLVLFVLYYSVQASDLEASCDGVPLPILMYHSVLKSQSGVYIVSPSELSKDFAYIQSHGYTAVTMAEVIDYVENGSPLPSKPIVLSFDDGCYNNASYVLPLLEEYHMKAVFSIVGEYTDAYSQSDEANPNYGYLRWKDVVALMESGLVEFQNHSYALHSQGARKGCMKKKGESESAYGKMLRADLSRLQDAFLEHTGYVPTTFTYPFGAVSNSSFPVIKELGFKASLSCAEGMNYLTRSPDCLYMLKRYNRSGNMESARFFQRIGLE